MSAFSASAPITFQTFIMDEPENGIPPGYSLGKLLGKGDFGEAHQFVKSAHAEAGRSENMGVHIELNLPDGSQTVLKKVNLVHHNEGPEMLAVRLQQFKDEVIIGNQLGSLGIAPRIYDWWICENTERNDRTTKRYGYYVMDTLSGVWKGEYGLNVAVAPPDLQIKLIGCVIDMVQLGLIHQDLHTGNISSDGLLFDFGLTLRIDDSIILERYGSLLVASQLYQMIEHSDYDDIVNPNNYVFNAIQLILQNPGLPLSQLKTFLSSTLQTPGNKHLFITGSNTWTRLDKCESRSLILKIILEHPEITNSPHPIGVSLLMLYMYDIIIHSETKDELYGVGDRQDEKNFMYNLIYLIRNNKIRIEEIDDWLNGGDIPSTLNSMKDCKRRKIEYSVPQSFVPQSFVPPTFTIGVKRPKRTRGGKRSGKSKTKKKRRSKTRKTRR
jgi:hypothetical protein